MARIFCKARKPKGRDNWFQCNRTKGHDGQHADTHEPPYTYWDQEPEA